MLRIPVLQANEHEQAARLRDVCLDLMQSHGVLRELSGYAVTEVALEPFAIWLYASRRQMSLLSIWYEGAGKVLTLRLEESAGTILKFQRGAWEGELLAFPSTPGCS